MKSFFRRLIVRCFWALLLVAAGIALGFKLARSEQFRIMWNKPLYLFDGRHKLHGDPRAAILDTSSELWIRDGASGQFIRLIPRAGIDFEGEQSLSMTSSRDGERVMYRLRPQYATNAAVDFKQGIWQPGTNDYLMYFEQRRYSNDTLIAYHKDAALGPGGLFFVDPRTGEHIARSTFSTLYVPTPADGSLAGPTGWLWAAAANRQFVEQAMTSTTAQSTWDTRYYRRVPKPASRTASGAPGELACDGQYFYLYHSPSTGWLRIKCEEQWQ